MSDTNTQSEDRPRFRRTRSNLVFIGLISGITAGLFFGEFCAPLGVVGTVFVNLLQMTVLPYIVVAIILRIGTLSRTDLRRLVTAAGSVLLLLWFVGGLLIAILPLALPEWQAGSYFSRSLIVADSPTSLMDQIVSANPFEALASGLVPAIVLFCICCGLSLSATQSKAHVLQLLAACEKVLLQINDAVLKIMPLGVFAIAANTAGTLNLNEASRIQGYLVLQIAATVICVFGLFPLLVAILTPLRYLDIVRGSRDIVIAALATGKVIAVLPLIIETSQRMLRERVAADDATATSAEAVIPLAYSFPHLGRLMALLFIPFSAWFLGRPLDLTQFPRLAGTGFLALFGSPLTAIPYLLDANQLPADMFQLFVASGVVCGPLADAVGAMHLLTIALVTPCILAGTTTFTPGRVAAILASGGLVMLATVVGARTFLAHSLPKQLNSVTSNADKSSPLNLRSGTVLSRPPNEATDTTKWQSRIDRVVETETLRVGYKPDNIPFTFINNAGVLVGFDVDMAQMLAEDLGVSVEFVPFELETLSDQLKRGDFDLAMSGIAMTPTRMLRMSLTEGYLDSTLAFVVRDHRRVEFSTASSLAELEQLTVAIPDSAYFERELKQYLPNAKILRVGSARDFFTVRKADALLISAEAGSAWTIEYPAFAVAVPQPDVTRFPLVYAAPNGDTRLSDLVSGWISLRRGTPAWHQVYDHWILGKSPRPREARWSVVRDVLHWVD
jgi:Na+/H+-dicarboxylate symporter